MHGRSAGELHEGPETVGRALSVVRTARVGRPAGGARVGSGTMLVAPVRVGRGAVTGAGSVITKNVPPGALAIERSEQRNVSGYRRKKDAKAKGKGSGG